MALHRTALGQQQSIAHQALGDATDAVNAAHAVFAIEQSASQDLTSAEQNVSNDANGVGIEGNPTEQFKNFLREWDAWHPGIFKGYLDFHLKTYTPIPAGRQ